MIRFATTIFLSAFLLFQIQPIIARYILPWFGGSAAVWTVCMLFFQIMLLTGYAYAHFLRIQFTLKHQAIIHSVLLILALFMMPITPELGILTEIPAQPELLILFSLFITVGLPYGLISATGPLFQHWFYHLYPDRSPYPLYALSNTASLLALVSYPFVFEPVFKLSTQTWLWSASFFVFSFSACFCIIAILKFGKTNEVKSVISEQYEKVIKNRLFWILLSASGSSLLLAVTNQICLDIAVIPFLWVLPLSLYLLSFIICFERPGWYQRRIWITLFFIITFLAIYSLLRSHHIAIIYQIVVFCSLLFTGCMICHGELFRLRPHPQYLTSFYLYIAVGGVLGGIFVALLAPLLYYGYWELHLTWITIIMLTGLGLFDHSKTNTIKYIKTIKFAWVCLTLFITLMLFSAIGLEQEDVIISQRNFFGVLRVKETVVLVEKTAVYRRLLHGRITHGSQIFNGSSQNSSIATTYYGDNSGIGVAINEHPKRYLINDDSTDLKIGVVGLGVGTIIAHAEERDSLRFYEINPKIITLSKTQFSWLEESPAEWNIVLGDARIMMNRELKQGNQQHFDVLAIDAFSGDSIPIHLLTEEAFEIYWQHLNKDGILAIHISNRHLDIRPIVYAAAQQLDVEIILVEDKGDKLFVFDSKWALLTRNTDFLNNPRIVEHRNMTKFEPDSAIHWTDDYSNLLSVLK